VGFPVKTLPGNPANKEKPTLKKIRLSSGLKEASSEL
jgi:hypothetical protein